MMLKFNLMPFITLLASSYQHVIENLSICPAENLSVTSIGVTLLLKSGSW